MPSLIPVLGLSTAKNETVDFLDVSAVKYVGLKQLAQRKYVPFNYDSKV